MFNYEKVLKLSILLGACALIATPMATVAIAQKPGDKVEYKAQNYPEKWEVGTFVKVLPGGTQVLIREKPNEFYNEGFERAYALDQIRPLTRNQAAPDQPGQRNAPPNPQPDQPRDAEPQPDKDAGDGGGPQMSQQDVLAFLRNRLGAGDPFMNPKREQALQELREQVLSRGVNFRYQGIGEFANDIGKFGPTTSVTSSLYDNYGPPARLNALLGKWFFAKVGAPGAPMFGNAGSLNINANGNYIWDSPSGVLRGQWRKATAEEMARSDKGGEGIVLLQAKSGGDWLVFKRNEEGPQGEGIKITDLATRNLRERGTRR
jgi:hypothetical protein